MTVRAFSLLDRSVKDIVGVTMPGFATSGKTEINANELRDRTGVNKQVVDVSTACKQYFDDIGHDEGLKDIAYENVQARKRTQILMNLANKEGGLVVGTSDLSELVLGWTTYNGDHMSMYAVNADVPKTLVKYLIEWVGGVEMVDASDLPYDVVDTPISPGGAPGTERARSDRSRRKSWDRLNSMTSTSTTSCGLARARRSCLSLPGEIFRYL